MNAKFDSIIEHFEKQLTGIHVGRVTPSLLDTVVVKAYDVDTPLSQVASITNQGAQTLVIQPWDASVVKEIEKGLQAHPEGYNPVVDGQVIRLNFPPLTEEKRKETVKVVHKIAEESHIAVKQVREDLMKQLKTQKQNSELSEDEFAAEQKTVQDLVDACNTRVKEITLHKEQEVMKI